MKSFTLIMFLFAVATVVTAYYYDDPQQTGLCHQSMCAADCFDDGNHGECGSDDICRCTNCIYRACRKRCNRQGRVGQCDEQTCHCL